MPPTQPQPSALEREAARITSALFERLMYAVCAMTFGTFITSAITAQKTSTVEARVLSHSTQLDMLENKVSTIEIKQAEQSVRFWALQRQLERR